MPSELYKSARRNNPRCKVMVSGLHDLYQANLVILFPYAHMNKEFKYMQTVIDCYSKFAFLYQDGTRFGRQKSTKNLHTNLGPSSIIQNYAYVGDYAITSRMKGTFDKGYAQNWSNESYIVVKTQHYEPRTYYFNYLDSLVIWGGFYNKEIQPITFSSTISCRKFLKCKGNKIYIHCMGFPDKKKCWTDKDNCTCSNASTEKLEVQQCTRSLEARPSWRDRRVRVMQTVLYNWLSMNAHDFHVDLRPAQ
ncbi:hypothetical protein PR048_016163, partial [Dryococelus australis]